MRCRFALGRCDAVAGILECEKRTLKRRISGWTRLRGWPLTLTRPLPCCNRKVSACCRIQIYPVRRVSKSSNIPNHLIHQIPSLRDIIPPIPNLHQYFFLAFDTTHVDREGGSSSYLAVGDSGGYSRYDQQQIHTRFSRRPEPKTHPSSSCRSIAHSGRKPW